MGLDRVVPVAGPAPKWKTIAARLPFAAPLRMIDGELAFPDEEPPAEWRELRIGTPAGMVTLRRVPEGIMLVVWGNADAALLEACDAVAAAIAPQIAGA